MIFRTFFFHQQEALTTQELKVKHYFFTQICGYIFGVKGRSKTSGRNNPVM